jgi:uncharacterized protein YfiM (DUF2279 family)
MRHPRLRFAARTAAVSVALILTLSLASGPAAAGVFLPADAQGGWTAADKEIHFASCLAISASLRAGGRTDAESFGCAVGIGVLKEVYDATLKPHPRRRGASWKDLVADVLGAAAGIAIVGALDR